MSNSSELNPAMIRFPSVMIGRLIAEFFSNKKENALEFSAKDALVSSGNCRYVEPCLLNTFSSPSVSMNPCKMGCVIPSFL